MARLRPRRWWAASGPRATVVAKLISRDPNSSRRLIGGSAAGRVGATFAWGTGLLALACAHDWRTLLA